MKFSSRLIVYTITIALFLCIPFYSSPQAVVPDQGESNFEISKNLEIFAALMRELDKNYADVISPGQLTEEAINAMLGSLDPYTVYIPESKAEDYKLMTTGQYGGIGALIHQQGDYVVISEIYEGFPAQKAGLLPGDRILEINHQSMKGKKSDEVSEILKGQPGVEISIQLERNGDTSPMLVKVIREEIKIPNIPYSGILEGDIAYIKLDNFTQGAANEVKQAFTDLKAKAELKGAVIDLRGNGGGLLNEAVNICNIFVDRNQLIVSTKGKLTARNQDHFTRFPAVDLEIPLVILVDNNSASASEILAGAIQDLDRGVIIGERTYGKGLVQNVLDLPYNAKVKVTVAKYYIPSGRCIQAIDYFNKDNNGNPARVPDSLVREFRTKNGRAVYDGYGVEPDIPIEPMVISPLSQSLITRYLLFDFANQYYREHPAIPPAGEFEVTDEIYQELTEFLKDKDYDYRTRSEDALEKLKASAEKEKYFDAISQDYEHLKSKMMHDKNADLVKFKPEISEILKLEIVSRYYYQKGQIIAALDSDPEIRKASELVGDKETYSAILDGRLDLRKSKNGGEKQE